MAKIKLIKATEILNAVGEPTIETTVVLSDGKVGIASCPAGSLEGSYEAMDLRDQDKARFGGKGVLKAIANVQNIISPALVGMEASNQAQIDRKIIELDGTQNKGRLGANTTFSVSMAVCKAAAKSSVLPLFLHLREFIRKESLPLKIPTPIFSLISDSFDFLCIPASSKSYLESITMLSSIVGSLRNTLKSNNFQTYFSDKGSFGISLPTNEDGLFLIKQAVEAINLRIGFDIFLGLDAQANYLYQEQRYHFRERNTALSSSDLANYYSELNKKFNLLYIEDPFSQDDWEAWSSFCKTESTQTLVAGGDLIATNPYRLQMALAKNAATGIVIKPIQIGTVIESLAVVEIAREAGLKIITSARSEETNDDFIADFSVAIASDYVKFGNIIRGERVSKYNRLFQIERQIKSL